jgi:exopolyphosphatase/guanosine-5'-triphosphate,3'-diphosphate pyrophosphatase
MSATNAGGMDRALAQAKIAALDLGSNSFHLVLAECAGESFTVTTHEKEPVQLGRSVFSEGVIDEPAFERGVAALRKLRATLDAERPQRTVAVATSALREARNGALFARQAELILGAPVRLINGEEEARYVASGALRSLPLRASRVAIFDLGGGSTEVILANAQGCAFVQSLPLGTLRLACALNESGRLRGADVERLEERTRRTLEPTLARLGQLGFDATVFSCGTARKLARLAGRLGFGPSDPSVLTPSTTARLLTELAALSPRVRAALTSREPGHVDTLLAGACVFKTVFAGLGVQRAVVAKTGLREGLIAHQLARPADERASRAAER